MEAIANENAQVTDIIRMIKQHVHHLQALPVLQAKFAIKRALMRLQIQVPKSCKAEAMELLEKLEAEIETKDFSTSQVKAECDLLQVQREHGQRANLPYCTKAMSC